VAWAGGNRPCRSSLPECGDRRPDNLTSTERESKDSLSSFVLLCVTLQCIGMCYIELQYNTLPIK
jgi:hypothetical protein